MNPMMLLSAGEDLEGLFSGDSVAAVAAMLYYAFTFLCAAAAYVITAYSLQKIARRRGISKPWLAWIPVGQQCLLGSISDHYQLSAWYTTKNKRGTLFWLQIIMFVLLAVMLMFFGDMVHIVDRYTANPQKYVWKVSQIEFDFWVSLILGLLALVLAVFITVIQYMSLFDLYRSCDPNNAALYLILSILISIAMPIFLLLVRNKDAGIPSRVPYPKAEE